MGLKDKEKKAIYYYQEDKENDHFKRFCDTFLGCLKVKPFEFEEPVPECLLLVFFLPSANRQNNVDMVSKFLVETKNNSHFKDTKDLILIYISFDGNNNINPPNVMDEDMFESVKSETMWDIASYMNIIYTDLYKFEDCDINKRAVRKLELLSNKR